MIIKTLFVLLLIITSAFARIEPTTQLIFYMAEPGNPVSNCSIADPCTYQRAVDYAASFDYVNAPCPIAQIVAKPGSRHILNSRVNITRPIIGCSKTDINPVMAIAGSMLIIHGDPANQENYDTQCPGDRCFYQTQGTTVLYEGITCSAGNCVETAGTTTTAIIKNNTIKNLNDPWTSQAFAAGIGSTHFYTGTLTVKGSGYSLWAGSEGCKIGFMPGFIIDVPVAIGFIFWFDLDTGCNVSAFYGVAPIVIGAGASGSYGSSWKCKDFVSITVSGWSPPGNAFGYVGLSCIINDVPFYGPLQQY